MVGGAGAGFGFIAETISFARYFTSLPVSGGPERPAPARGVRRHETHPSEDEEQDRDENQLVRER
jgi:hypothetical protein